MAIVVFSSALAQHTGGARRVEIEAARVVDLVKALCERFPDLRGHVDKMAVAIDDEIHNDALFVRLEPNSEVHFIPRVSGG